MSRRTPAVPAPDPGQGRRRHVVEIAAAVAAAVALGAVGVVALTGDDDEPRAVRAAASAGPSGSAAPAPSTSGGPEVAGPSLPPTPVQAWRDAVLKDYSPLAQSSFSAVRTITEWNLRRATPADVRSRVEVALQTSQDTVKALAVRKPLPGTEQALTQFRAGADLYISSLQTVLAATALPSGPLQTQVRRAAARQRDLGDRVYDLAQSSLVPVLPKEQTFDDVELRKPPEVPDYDAVDLGVGPPLAPAEPKPGPVRTFQAQRPEQDVAAWVAALDRLALPSGPQVLALLQSAPADRLAATAEQLVLGSDRLRELADPAGARNVSTQVQLGLLVEADALRTAQAAVLAPAAQRLGLRQAAAGLGRTGTSLAAARP
ncbi:MAG: hypothetical protein JWM64_1170 [Frankiales bacterium]|nr:hypothetical protein [Frankiales bacterium]